MPVASIASEHFDTSIIDNRVASLGRMFLDRVKATPDAEAFRFPVGESGWSSITWRATELQVSEIAAGLIELGIQPEERVALACSTRLEWYLIDQAVMCSGAATTTVYPTTGAADVAYIVSDSQSRSVIAEDDDQIAKLREHRAELPDVAKVITIDGTADGDWVVGLDDVRKLGRERLAAEPSLIEDTVSAITPEHLATLIYTSGTTGRPKGVRIRQSSWTYVAASIQSTGLLHEDDVQYLWLPLAHVFGKMLLALPLAVGFSTVIDGRIDKIVDNLAVVQPTFMGAAPRIFEKAYGRISTMIATDGGVKAKLFAWAFGVGREVGALRQQNRRPSAVLGAKHAIADKLVLSKVRNRFGGKLRFFISGASALDGDLARWFDAAGILILEGYGLTETSAATFVNRPTAYEFGTVGWIIPGSEVKIADDGEILIKGAGVMEGYHNMPEATAEALVDGWFHTGDIGSLDGNGFLRVTDRKKDLFKTSGGKYVAPSAIESLFKGICPYASQLVVHGNNRNFVSALVTLDPEAIGEWAKSNGMGSAPYAEVVTSDAVHALVQGYVDSLNEKLNRWETIKKFVILDHDLTVESGELTPSLKLKRKVVFDNYKTELDGMYS